MRARILLIEADVNLAEGIKVALEHQDYNVSLSTRGNEGLGLAKENPFDVVITALRVPRPTGLEIIRQLHSVKPKLPIILITAFGTTETAIEASRLGAFEYLTKPFSMSVLLDAVTNAIACSQPGLAALQVDTANLGKSRIAGRSPAMQRLYKEIGRAAKTSLPVLICGETGCGKELVARAIHEYSSRADQPFIALNCTAIPDTLLESELFGHERGAFTNAEARRIGCFEHAKGGTVFLDEIGDMSPATQVKLLRVLQEKYIQRVGSNTPIRVAARILSASHQDLHAAMHQKLFREDLFYRLAGLIIRLPPLSERLEDIPDLVSCFLRRIASEHGIQTPSIQTKAVAFLQNQTWKGNVRELENAIGYAFSLAGQHPINLSDVQQACAAIHGPAIPSAGGARSFVNELFLKARRGEIKNVYSLAVEEMDRELFSIAIQAAHGNQAEAARWLGVTRRTVREKLSRFRMNPSGDGLKSNGHVTRL